MTRMRLAAATVLVAATGVWAVSGFASHDEAIHSDNMRLIANYGGDHVGGQFVPYRNGTDMAFWGDLAVLGNLDQGTGPMANPLGGFRLMDVNRPSDPRLVGRFSCPGDQSDVSIWGDLVLLSVDKPTREYCTDEANAARGGSASWEGLRIVSIADRQNPQIVGTVDTRCGSHTHTIVPDPANDRLVVYVLSYPLAGRYNPADKMVPAAVGGPGCNPADHGLISVVTVPLGNPAAAEVVATPSVRPSIGCHDVTVFLERRLAAAACLTESQIWDISDPDTPEIVSHIPNAPGMNLSHSTIFDNAGETLVIGDELGGAAASPGCTTGDQRDVPGGLFFYDVAGAKAKTPQLVGTFKLPQRRASLFCTAHLFNVVPTRRDDDVLVTSWYSGATSVIDFSDPSRPQQIAYYIPSETTSPDEQPTEAAAWASYWYRGVVFSNNFDEDVNSVRPRSRGLDVFSVDHESLRGALRLPRLNPQVQEPLPGGKRAKR